MSGSCNPTSRKSNCLTKQLAATPWGASSMHLPRAVIRLDYFCLFGAGGGHKTRIFPRPKFDGCHVSFSPPSLGKTPHTTPPLSTTPTSGRKNTTVHHILNGLPPRRPGPRLRLRLIRPPLHPPAPRSTPSRPAHERPSPCASSGTTRSGATCSGTLAAS